MDRPRGRKRRDSAGFRWPGYTPWVALGIVIIGVLAGVAVINSKTTPSGAQVGEHLHAQISSVICGQKLVLPASPGAIHSHGDGQIHIHPGGERDAGENANLGRFFDNSGMTLNSSVIQFPRQERVYQNGEACPDGTLGAVRVLVNGKDRIEDFRTYTPRDGDRIEVRFD